jgi:propionyl-CoA carboxylase beta chain
MDIHAIIRPLGGASTHAKKSGVVHLALENEIEALTEMRRLFDFLPLNNMKDNTRREYSDPRDREEA